MNDTIFALSSGSVPAAIAVVRISGPDAGLALASLVGPMPPPRSPSVRRLRDEGGETLDIALVTWFAGPRTATGEDLAELHCHGGRAVVAAVLDRLGRMPGLREAEPGEFTRRAFANGQIDLAQAEGLADLLSAETEWQRRGALVAAGGALSNRLEDWRSRVLVLSAELEAAIDFSDEDDVASLSAQFRESLAALADEIERVAQRPSADRMRDGVRVVFAGPPNAGKSSLFNALLNEGVAIVSAEAGTTRDVIERPVALGGVPFVFADTAGLRDTGAGEIEEIGIERARDQMERADIVLWLGSPDDAPKDSIRVLSKSDLIGDSPKHPADYFVSSVTGHGLDELSKDLVARGKLALPPPDRVALNRRQKGQAREAGLALSRAAELTDMLAIAEELRTARVAIDRLSGRNSTEDMLDALFGRFCIGK